MSIADRFRNCVTVLDNSISMGSDPAAKLAWAIVKRQLETPLTELLNEEAEAVMWDSSKPGNEGY